MKKLIYWLLPLIIVVVSCSNNEGSSKDWKYGFVVYHGYNYIVTEEHLKESELDKKVGEIQKYSDNEMNAPNGTIFSNEIKKGTPLYSIKHVDKQTSLAVKSDDGFIKITSNGKYGE